MYGKDCSSAFTTIFGGIGFKTQNEFEKALKIFEQQSGTQYIRAARQCHPNGTVQRNLFEFKHAQYACNRRGSGIRRGSNGIQPATGCTARFTASSTGAVLRVLKFDMLHNHPPEQHIDSCDSSLRNDKIACGQTLDALEANDEDLPVISDLTQEFLQLFKGKSFSSFDDLLRQMNVFMKTTGSNYVMRNTVKLPDNSPDAEKLVYKSVAFECYHFGTYTSYASIRPKQRTVKFGCRSKVYFYGKDGKFNVGKYQVKHNHEVNPNSSGVCELSRRGTKTKPSKSQKVYEHILNGVINSNFEDDYDLIKVDPDCVQADFDPTSPLIEKPPCWMQEPVANLYSVPETLPRRTNKLLSSTMTSQIDSCFDNLRCLACSDGANRFIACMKDLLSLESKWRSEFDDHPPHPIDVSGEVLDVVCEGSPPLTESGFPNDAFPARRRKHNTPMRHPVWDLSPVDIPQPSVFNQTGSELLDRSTPWFYE